jgi:hypothetical protein
VSANLYLDGTTRQALNLLRLEETWAYAPPGAIVQTISDDDATRIRTAWQAASLAGQVLVVNPDLTTTASTPATTAMQQAFATLRDYVQNPSPTAADTVTALKTLIRVVRGLVV